MLIKLFFMDEGEGREWGESNLCPLNSNLPLVLPFSFHRRARKKLCWLPTRRKYIYSATLENSYRNLSLSPLGQWDSSW